MNDKELIEHALKAQKLAMAPYSNYKVGAAILSEDKEITIGFNIESKAYPTTICAERVAIFSALTKEKKKFISLAVVTDNQGTPCGSCRQIIHEYAGDIKILIADNKNNYYETTTNNLLPNPFG
tara:strand:- start:897 stop:1268 length:372 start_codon:yes stop_codon:yes gene_type:complete